MSTKIYDAYKYHGNIENLPKIFSDIVKEFINGGEFKKNILRLYHPYDVINFKHMNRTIKFIKDIDDMWAFGDYINNKDFNPFIDEFNMSATVHFDRGEIYCMFFNVPYKLVKNSNLFTDFHYQDSTDMSNFDESKEPWSEMSYERKTELENDWDNRRNTWDRIFKHTRSPKLAGLSYDMSPFDDRLENRRNAYHIFKKTFNDPILLRKLKIRRLNYVMNHKKHVDKIIADGGNIHEIRDYVLENKLKMRDLEGWE